MPEQDSALLMICLWGVLGYLMGSIPFGLIVSRWMGLGNLRQIGSGNIGATNVLRTGSKTAAAATLLLDGGKGAVMALLARMCAGEDAAQVAGLAALIGHCFPVWLKFQGGKGVATFLGLLLALAWPVGIACCLTWLVVAVLMRISSVSALAAAALAPVWAMVLGQVDVTILCALMAVMIFWRHKQNIGRLIAGTEPRIGK